MTGGRNIFNDPLISIPFNIGEYIRLDNGTAYLGFVQESFNLLNTSIIQHWDFQSHASSNVRDSWNGLSLDYRSHWPLHLMFSPDVIEKYNTLFRFLLPIKRIQLDLQFIWAYRIRN